MAFSKELPPLAPDAPSGPGDSDGDGVMNDVDNCPTVANPDQHDEDHDGIGDACDLCPHIADANEDTDGDGVGDACDPEPTIPRQHWLMFDGFGARQGWSLSGGMVVDSDVLHAPSASLGCAVASCPYAYLSVPTGEARIIAAGTVNAAGSGTSHSFSILFGFDSTGAKYHYGVVYDDTTGVSPPAGVEVIYYTGAFNVVGSVPSSFSPPVPSGQWSMQIDESASAHTVSLSSTVGGVVQGTINRASAPNLLGTSGIGVFVVNLDMTLDYIGIIVTNP